MAKFDIEKIKRIIESGEPIFILRGKDKFAPMAIKEYSKMVFDDDPSKIVFVNDVLTKAVDIQEWQFQNPDKVKSPD